jgi:HD-GYP domain-containing protein (c-di-GMP phosphodiesterase class II)
VIAERANPQVRALLKALDLYLPGSEMKAEWVAALATAIGERSGLSDEELLVLRVAAALHDIGKLAVPRAILSLERPLTMKELAAVRAHVLKGSDLIASIADLAEAAPAVRHLYERPDGNGFPAKLSGEGIPVASRILAVCNSFVAMRTPQPWRPALDEDAAIRELEQQAGRGYDEAAVAHLKAVHALIQPVVCEPNA